MYHFILWPSLLHVAEDGKGRIVGYVLAKMGDEPESKEEKHGHITSLAVLRSYRRMGIATQLMQASHRDMYEVFGAKYCSLHVRAGNKAGRHLYEVTLGYSTHDIERGYYANGEDAHSMRLRLPEGLKRNGGGGGGGAASTASNAASSSASSSGAASTSAAA